MSIIQQLAQSGNRSAILVMDAYNPDQERDEKGMWTSGAASATAETASRTAAAEGSSSAHVQAYSAHRDAARMATTPDRRAYHEQKSLEHYKAATAAMHVEGGKENLRATQKELPVIRSMTTSQMAPHASLPVGNTKPTRMGSDPNAKTQELKAMPEGHPASYASTHNVQRETAQALARNQNLERQRPLSRQDRAQAAAASAGQWASRALTSRRGSKR